MPTSVGPNTKGEENLVFGYDLGDVSNSYKGEPTANLTTDTPSQTGWMGTYSLIDSASKTFTITTQQNNAATTSAWRTWYWSVSSYIGSYVTISADVEFVSETNCNFLHLHMGQGNTGTYPYHIAGSDVADRVKIETKPIEKVHLTWSGIINSTGIVGFTQWIHNVTVNGANSVLRISNVQIEAKSHASPFTTGTRSATQGLIDLTGNSTIDLTNVSFDSNAQMEFDGTDDTASVNSYSAIELVDNVSIEYVYKRLSTDPILDVIANKYHSTGWELFCQTGNTFALAGRNGDGTYYSTSNAAYTIQNNKYYHLVAIKEGLSWRLYVNGELYSFLTANTVGTWSNTGILQIGGEGNGYYPNMKLPVFKIYNRVLTASEIKANYNAIKGRFNI